MKSSKYSHFCDEESKKKKNDIELVCLTSPDQSEEILPEMTVIHNFQCTENFLDYFESPYVLNLLEDNNKVFLFKLEIQEAFSNLNSTELSKLTEKCKNNSVVILLSTENGKRFFLYWKSNKIQHFLIFKPYNRLDIMHNILIFEFLATFLTNSLRRDHLGIHSQVQIHPDSNSYELHLLADHRNYNLLLVAAEIGNIFFVNFMLDGGFSAEAHDTNAQTLAWNGRHFEIIWELLKSNYTFPDGIDIDKCPENIKDFTQISQELNEAMVLRNAAKVLEILSKNPGMKHFYNLDNESALAFALRNKLFDMYSLLISSSNVKFGPHEKFSKIKDSMRQSDKKVLREIHYKKSKLLPDNHMHVLLLNSRLGHDTTDTEKKFEIIQKAFEILNENPFIQVILMVVAASRNFQIIFDFNCDSVEVMDPTSNNTTRGLFYPTGRIYVAAKKLLDERAKYDALGTLVHELCHYAVNVVYKNSAKPYYSRDDHVKNKIEEVLEFCKENSGKEEIIDLVHQCYPDHVQHAELIVRAPHLIMLYWNQPNKFDEIRSIFIKLFDIFENKVIPEMKKALPSIETKAECEVQTKNRKIRNLKLISIIGGLLLMIVIISGALIIRSILNTPPYRYSDLSDAEKLKIQNAPINYKNITLVFKDLYSNSSKVYDSLSSDHISHMLHSNKPLNMSGSNADYLNGFINHKWKNLTEKLKPKILNSNFSFQNETVRFRMLKTSILESLTSQQIVEILDNKAISVPQSVNISSKIYIERNMFFENIYEIYFKYMNHVGSMTSQPCNYTLYQNETFEEFYSNFLRQSITTQIETISHIKDSNDFIHCSEFGMKLHDQKGTKVIDKLEDHSSIQIGFDEILDVANKTKIFILSSEAGTGKSTTFQQLTLRIKKRNPTLWVSYIDLRDFKDLFKNVNTLGDVSKLLDKIHNFDIKDKFQKAIFDECFMTGKTVFLWIGVDDIFLDKAKEFLKFLRIIQSETRNIHFISTRPSYSAELMQTFRTKSYTFIPFSIEEQEKFLRKIFISQNLTNETLISTYLEKIHKIVNSVKLKDDMTPLLLRMIAELISNDKEIFETENVYEIYEKFIGTKIMEWTKSEFGKKFLEFNLKEFYQQCALKILPESFALSLNSINLEIMKFKASKNLTKDEISRMEILYVNGPKGIKFVHDSFTDFFFAQYLIENIYSLDVHDNASVQELDYRLRVFCGSFEYPLVTSFIASFLESKAAKSTEKFHPKLTNLFKTKFKRIFLNILKLEKVDIFPWMMTFFQKDHELLIDLLQINQNKTVYTELFNYGNFQNFVYYDENLDLDEIKSTAKNHLKSEEYPKFLNGSNQKGIILYSLYCFYKREFGNKDYLFVNKEYTLSKKLLKTKDPNYVFNTIAKNLTNEELKELLTSKALLYNIQLSINDVNIFDQQMWIRIEENLSSQEQKLWLTDIIQIVSLTPDRTFAEPFFLKIDKIFSNLEIVKLFQDSQILQISASFSISIFKYLWNFFVSHSTKIEQMSVLRQQVEIECTGDFNPYGDCYLFPSLNILQASLLDPNFFAINDIRNIYTTYFNPTEIQNLILSSDNFLPYFFYLCQFENCESLDKLLKTFFVDNYSKNSLKKFYIRTRDILPGFLNYEYYEEKFEILTQAIYDLTY